MIVAAIVASWIAIAALAVRVEREIATRRHVKITVNVFNEELQRVRVESLGTPGGIETIRAHYRELPGGSNRPGYCLDCDVLLIDVLDRDGYYKHRNTDGSYHICPAGNDGPGYKFKD